MIWFTCKKCGKTHGRSDNSAGTMVFCECGHGNTVPWESTTAQPVASLPVTAVPNVPNLEPIQFDPVNTPSTSAGGTASGGSAKQTSYPTQPVPPIEDEDRPYRRGRTEKRDPDFCFNHQRRPKAQACIDCELNFCPDCLVSFQGALVCGPCKNFRARRQELPPSASTMASASLIISLIAGPITMCMLLASPNSDPMKILSWLSLLPQAMALGLGIWALRDAEVENKGGGQWVAVSGIAIAGTTCLLVALLNIYASRIIV